MNIDSVLDGLSAFALDFIGDKERAKLIRGQLDEGRERHASFIHEHFLLSPKGSDYRAVRYQDGRLGLQSLYKNEWVDLCFYDDGHDDYGRLNPAKWKPLSDWCCWDERSLKLLRENILGIVVEPQPI